MQLTGIIIQDDSTQRFTAYLHQFPGVIAEGKDMEETKIKLEKSWLNFVKYLDTVKDGIEYKVGEI